MEMSVVSTYAADAISLRNLIDLDKLDNILLGSEGYIGKFTEMLLRRAVLQPSDEAEVHFRFVGQPNLHTQRALLKQLASEGVPVFAWVTAQEVEDQVQDFQTVLIEQGNPVMHEGFLIVVLRSHARALIWWTPDYDYVDDGGEPKPTGLLVTSPDDTYSLLAAIHTVLTLHAN